LRDEQCGGDQSVELRGGQTHNKDAEFSEQYRLSTENFGEITAQTWQNQWVLRQEIQ
jgi:hypothetical protein